uniref:acetyl-CoA C-acetyltransferase n=1 Tax=Callorhinchus milii TaxID=7868 RepID=A0A4W3GG16_CALMI
RPRPAPLSPQPQNTQSIPRGTTPDELLATVMAAVLRDVNLSPHHLGDICVGNVLQPGAGAFMARVAQFLRAHSIPTMIYLWDFPARNPQLGLDIFKQRRWVSPCVRHEPTPT